MTIIELCNYIDINNILYGYNYDCDDQMYSDGETEYQLIGYGNGASAEVKSILVRFCDDDTHSYKEYPFTPDLDLDALLHEITSFEYLDAMAEEISYKRAQHKSRFYRVVLTKTEGYTVIARNSDEAFDLACEECDNDSHAWEDPYDSIRIEEL